ncbi:2-phospho-L-lactate guanylyltransferase [Microbacterium sp. B2969]|uniref:2-phospho-L-lactate guanylyltransferase n=1 Tax=Microbacterium alkaliflavum TaxID=3248839 RepID=A0ABW7Q1Z5_9MICO
MTAAWTVVLPVKHAARAKSRLASLRGPGIARAIALDTIDAVAACEAVARVVVVTDDSELAALVAPGVEVVADLERAGPDAAIASVMATLPVASPRAALLADLPALRPADLAAVLSSAGPIERGVIPDAEGTGSTLVTTAPGVVWRSAFGADSFARHVALGCVPIPVDEDSSVRRDVDTPAHLAAAAELGLGPRTAEWWAAASARPAVTTA